MSYHGQLSWMAQIGMVIFVLAFFFCSHEMVPGWGFLDLDWPASTHYLIMAIIGATAGLLAGEKYWLAGIVGGALAGPGSILVASYHLANVNETWDILIVLLGGLGALPGVGAYWLIRFVQSSVAPPSDSDWHGGQPPPTPPQV